MFSLTIPSSTSQEPPPIVISIPSSKINTRSKTCTSPPAQPPLLTSTWRESASTKLPITGIKKYPFSHENLSDLLHCTVHDTAPIFCTSSRYDHPLSHFNHVLDFTRCEFVQNKLELGSITPLLLPSEPLSLSWHGDKLLTAHRDSCVYFYRFDPSDDDIFSFSYKKISDSPLSISCSQSPENITPHAIFTHDYLKSESFQEHKMSQNILHPSINNPTNRINYVSVCPYDTNLFLSLANNKLHIWNFEIEKEPIAITSPGPSPRLLCAAWDLHAPQQHIMLGGLGPSLSLVDLRMMNAPRESGSCAWSIPFAHELAISTLDWHPFHQYWVATGGMDGKIKIWDIRSNGHHPMWTIEGHTNSVRMVRWSPYNSETLASGGNDSLFRLHNLTAGPQANLFEATLKGSVSGVGFLPSSQIPSHVFATTQPGRSYVYRMDRSFFGPLLQQKTKFPPELQDIETSIFFRNFADSFRRAHQQSLALYDQGQFEKALDLIRMCYQQPGPKDVPIGSNTNGHVKEWASAEMERYAYYIPPGYHDRHDSSAQVDPKLREDIEVLRLKIELEYYVSKNNPGQLLALLPAVTELLYQDHTVIAVATLKRIIRCVMSYNYLRAIEFTIETADNFFLAGAYSDFAAVPLLFFFPSIYDDIGISPKKSDKERNIKLHSFLFDCLAVTKELNFAKAFLSMNWTNLIISNSSTYVLNHFDFFSGTLDPHILDFVQKNCPVPLISASLNRIILNFYSQTANFESFFIFSQALLEEIENYPFAKFVRMMILNAIKRFEKTVGELINTENEDYQKTDQFEHFILMLSHIIYSPKHIPTEITSLLDSILNLLVEKYCKLLSHLESICNPDSNTTGKIQAKGKVEHLLAAINGIPSNNDEEGKRVFFERIEGLLNMCNKFIF